MQQTKLLLNKQQLATYQNQRLFSMCFFTMFGTVKNIVAFVSKTKSNGLF